jgi:hypothetical protein
MHLPLHLLMHLPLHLKLLLHLRQLRPFLSHPLIKQQLQLLRNNLLPHHLTPRPIHPHPLRQLLRFLQLRARSMYPQLGPLVLPLDHLGVLQLEQPQEGLRVPVILVILQIHFQRLEFGVEGADRTVENMAIVAIMAKDILLEGNFPDLLFTQKLCLWKNLFPLQPIQPFPLLLMLVVPRAQNFIHLINRVLLLLSLLQLPLLFQQLQPQQKQLASFLL